MTITHHGSPLHDRLTDSCLACFVKRCVSATRMQAATIAADWLAMARVRGLYQHARECRYVPKHANRRKQGEMDDDQSSATSMRAVSVVIISGR